MTKARDISLGNFFHFCPVVAMGIFYLPAPSLHGGAHLPGGRGGGHGQCRGCEHGQAAGSSPLS